MPAPSTFLILGCGYTAGRVARQLVQAGERALCTNRAPAIMPGVQCVALDAADPESLAALAAHLSPNMIVLHSIPPAGIEAHATDYTSALLQTLLPFSPARIVYLSTTGVYGAAQMVDERTPAAPDTPRDRLRVQAENLIASGPWSHLILRPAAIYGPGRGVQASVQNGTFTPRESRLISRIHVDDLAAQTLAGLRSHLTGAFPLADEEPSTSLDVALLTARLLGLPPPNAPESSGNTGRRVNGAEYRRISGTALRYPTYRQGVPACLGLELGLEMGLVS